MSETLVRIVAPHFVCGVVAVNGRIQRVAPIVKYMMGWNGKRLADYCAKKKWIWERLNAQPNR